jgi:hypothetical protein
MNPYDFARIDWSRIPVRRKPIWHHQLVKPGTPLYSGSLEVDIYAETPIFISNPRTVAPNSRDPAQFMSNAQGEYIIPGSSLKGMLRSVVEALGNSCLTLFDGDYEHGMVNYRQRMPREFQKCGENDKLCLACRIFGMLKERQGGVFLGKVNLGDARADPKKAYKYDAIYTGVLVEPKPRHEAFYLEEDKRHVAGRKFYFHHSPDHEPLTEKRLIFMGSKPANRYIQPLDYETSFRFRLDFTALEADEFGALLQAIVLEDTMRHKLGYGKPLGLGSVQLSPVRLTLVDYAARYAPTSQADAKRGKRILEGDEMWKVLYEHADTFTSENRSDTTRDYLSQPAMEDLRHIWRWPPEPGTAYYYPSKYEWFDTPASQGKRISETRNVPGGR